MRLRGENTSGTDVPTSASAPGNLQVSVIKDVHSDHSLQAFVCVRNESLTIPRHQREHCRFEDALSRTLVADDQSSDHTDQMVSWLFKVMACKLDEKAAGT